MAQIDTLRPPDGGSTSGWTVTGAASQGAALNDDSDSSYTQDTGGFGNLMESIAAPHNPPADHERHQARIRVRAGTATGTGSVKAGVTGGGDYSGALTTFPLTITPTSFIGPWQINTGDGELLDLLRGVGSQFWFSHGAVTGQGNVRVIESYIDIDCRHKPDFTPDVRDGAGASQDGGTVSDTNEPTFHFGAIDYDGLSARDWSIKVFPVFAESAYPSAVLAKNPLAYWRMSGAAATADETGNSHTLTWSGSPNTEEPGVVVGDEGVDLDGTNDFAIVANEADLELYEDMTIEMWVRPHDNIGGIQSILTCRGASDGAYGLYELFWWPDFGGGSTLEGFLFGPWTTAGGGDGSVVTSDTYANQWTHLVVTIEWLGGGGRQLTFYVNGQQVGGSDSGSYEPGIATRSVNIGRRADENDQYFDGDISELAIFDRVLTPEEVAENYEAWFPGPVFEDSGSGTPPSSISLGDIPNGSYIVEFQIDSTIRSNDAFPSIEQIEFEMAYVASDPPANVSATVINDPPSVEVCWEDPYEENPWNEGVVTEIRRTDCNGTSTIARIEDTLEGCFTDRFMSLSYEGVFCNEEDHDCEVCYEIRYVGVQGGIPVSTDWTEPECVTVDNPTPGNAWIRGMDSGDLSVCPDESHSSVRPFVVFQPLRGGKPTVTTGATGGRDYSLSIPVTSEEDLQDLLAILAQEKVFYQPVGQADTWQAPNTESINVLRKIGNSRIRVVSVQMVATTPSVP